MAEIVPINPTSKALLEQRTALSAVRSCRERGDLKLLLIQPVLEWKEREPNLAIRQITEITFQKGMRGELGIEWTAAAKTKKKVSAKSLQTWYGKYREEGPSALIDKHKGRQRDVKGCEALILEYYNYPSRPDAGDIAAWLKEHHGIDLPRWWIDRYIKSLPADLGSHSAKRHGKSYHKANIAPHATRDVSDLLPGEVWVADGHKLKILCRNSMTGDFYRLEVTAILDVRSNYCLGHWFSIAESADNTAFAFCSAAYRHGGFPVIFYSDNGPGFANHRVEALFIKSGTRHQKAKPGHPHSKGFGEGFFRIVTKRFSKQWKDAFCGDDRTDDVIARYRTKHKRGEIYIPADNEVIERFGSWVEHYNRTPQPGSDRLQGKAPADLICNLTLAPLNVAPAELLHPHIDATVQRGKVQFKNRTYEADFLCQYERKKLRIEYDQCAEDVAWAFDAQGRYLGDVMLCKKSPFAGPNVMADARAKSALAAERRAEIELDRARNRFAPASITAATVVDALDFEPVPAPALTAAEQILAQGHSLTTPLMPAQRERASRPILQSELDQVAAAFAAESQIPETPADRFSFAQNLQSRIERGEAIDESVRHWLDGYLTNSEYVAHRLIHDQLGASQAPR